MPVVSPVSSTRRDELLERAYRYVLAYGLGELSLRPLARAVGSSPRVLLFLFGSKDGLLRALIARARADELAFLDGVRARDKSADLGSSVKAIWRWLCAPPHRPLLTLWLEAYARSLVEPRGPWRGFARQTVADWLALLQARQPARRRGKATAERTLALAVLRGTLLDLLATGDVARTTSAVNGYVALLAGPRASRRGC